MTILHRSINTVQSLPVQKRTRALNATIHDLPSEILCYVFVMLVTDAFYGSRSTQADYTWLPITYVCQGWRDLAIQYSPLWSYLTISDKYQQWTKVMLHRSATSSLTVRAEANAKTLPLLRLALADPKRVHELDIVTCEQDVQWIIDALPEFYLQDLRLTITDPGRHALSVAPQTLFAPRHRLHTLHLRGINIPCIASSRMTSLLHLDICTPKQVTVEEVSGLMRTVTSLTSLQSLSLDLKSYGDNRVIGIPQTHFNVLRNFSIQGHTSCLVDLLNIVRYPSNTILACTSYRSDPMAPRQEELNSLLCSHCCYNKFGLPTSLLVEEYQEDEWGPHAIRGLRVVGYRQTQPVLILQFASPLDFGDQGQWFAKIWPILPLDYLETLELRQEYCIGWTAWLRRAPLQHLNRIIVTSSSSDFFRFYSEKGTTYAATILCPRLQNLEFNDIDFAQGGHNRRRAKGVVYYEDDRFSHHFPAFLRYRQSCSTAVLNVHLSGCSNIPDRVLLELQGLCNLSYESMLPNDYPAQFKRQQEAENAYGATKVSLFECD